MIMSIEKLTLMGSIDDQYKSILAQLARKAKFRLRKLYLFIFSYQRNSIAFDHKSLLVSDASDWIIRLKLMIFELFDFFRCHMRFDAKVYQPHGRQVLHPATIKPSPTPVHH